MSEQEEHQVCKMCGERGSTFDWVNGVPVWKCKCENKWKDTRW